MGTTVDSVVMIVPQMVRDWPHHLGVGDSSGCAVWPVCWDMLNSFLG
jgi:hypothetical protein